MAFLGPDPVPALGASLPVVCADGSGLSRGSHPDWEAFDAPAGASSPDLLELSAVRQRLSSRVEAVVVWKSSAKLERLARELGVAVANAPALLARRIENKSYFSRAAGAAGLPLPPTRTGTAGPRLLEAARELSPPFVFQLAHGFSGEHTYPARSDSELAVLVGRFQGRSCRVSERVLGTPVTVTGVVSPGRLLVGTACVQLTGQPSLTPHPLGSCGNDFGRPVPAPEAVGEVALRTADWLRRQGHLGIFGLDLVVTDAGAVHCIEVNPRLVASVPLFSLSARDHGAPGILSHHLASFGLVEPPLAELACHWSQLILYQMGSRRSGPGLGTSQGNLPFSGDFSSAGGVGLEGPPPGSAALLVQGRSRPGRELARLIFEGPCSAPDGTLLPHLRTLAAQIRSQLEAPSTS